LGSYYTGSQSSSSAKKVHEYDKRGVLYALDNPLEVSVANKIKSLVPGAQMLRYFVSGTEATMHAIRIARAYTKKEKIVKFEGHYHGQDLVISKQLRMNIYNYRSIFPHVAAAIQLSSDERVSRGDNIEYIYTDSQHSRVVPAQFIRNNGSLKYDREKYKEMLLDASETVLGIFGFDRTLFGKPKDKKWWMQLKRNGMSDVKVEINSY
jgi:glutamate-1-semialdehyde aminotransferase